VGSESLVGLETTSSLRTRWMRAAMKDWIRIAEWGLVFGAAESAESGPREGGPPTVVEPNARQPPPLFVVEP
jgi:hypothetical protein